MSWFKTWAGIIALVLALLLGVWQTCTFLYLRNDLRGWLIQHGGSDGTTPPPPPPAF